MSDQPFRREAGSEATPQIDLVQWLTEQIDQDEQVARAATPGPWMVTHNSDYEIEPDVAGPGHDGGGVWERADAAHIALHDPVRVLRQVAAYRRILARHHPSEVPAWDRSAGALGIVARVECVVCVERGGVDWDPTPADWPCPDVRSLASIYSDRPGFDSSWAM